YLVPQSPYCWFDRPPGINRIIGIPWTARILYPQIFSDMDMTALTKEFYLKFYHYELSEDELNSLLVPSLRGYTVNEDAAKYYLEEYPV
ncbi:MAG: hypothetical protein Q7V06_04740, partial [Methanocalculus sp.]|nr:hypothetical protein [Methanocalculus sp.]